MATETLKFQAEVQELLGLMIHSLYKHRDIFLRELISNASDALDKLRFEALTDAELLEQGEELAIRIEIDREARTLSVIDNGIGMDRQELVENLGTIARSGTRRFLERLHEHGSDELPDLIGQFGVGFYSSFMVAEEVVVETCRSAGSGVVWRSRGDGEYSLEELEAAPRGTRVTLHLRAEAEQESAPDLTAEWTIRDIVKRYSDFVEYPIQMEVERREPKRDAEGKEIEGEEPEVIVETQVLNSMKPLWCRDRDAISSEEYNEFYKHVTHDWQEPIEVIHFKAEGTTEYTALLYIPTERPFDLFDGTHVKSRLALYVRRVFIMSDCEDLLPNWLRFVRGLIDSPDLPLNVSRETLQHNRTVRQIEARLVKKVIETLGSLLEQDRERYERFWKAFGIVLKEGIHHGADEDERISRLCLFESSAGEELTTLAEYVERMPEEQEAIYTMSGDNRVLLESSPHLEACRSKGFEVLFLTDPVDEWVLGALREFDGKPLRSVEKGELDLGNEADEERREQQESEYRDLLSRMQEILEDRVQAVRFSKRLTDSAAVLVSSEEDLSPHIERLLRQAKREVQSSKRALELNPEHALIQRMKVLFDADAKAPRLTSFCELLYGQALLTEGSSLPDPAAFSRLLTELMVSAD